MKTRKDDEVGKNPCQKEREREKNIKIKYREEVFDHAKLKPAQPSSFDLRHFFFLSSPLSFSFH